MDLPLRLAFSNAATVASHPCDLLVIDAMRRCCPCASLDLPLGTLVYSRPPISLIRAPAHLLWHSIALHYQLPRLLITERRPITVAHLIRFVSTQHCQHRSSK